jgi:hypothetical protein
MPGSNWDPTQHLNASTHQVEWPTGPYNTGAFNPTWVDAWVMQDPGVLFPFPGLNLPGPSQSAHGSSGTGSFAAGQWTAGTAGWLSGKLEEGPALGIALIAMRDAAGHHKFDWWLDLVNLKY